MDLPASTQRDLPQELTDHMGFVQRLARALIRDGEVAEDIAQEALLAAVAQQPHTESGIRSWLTAVVRRQALLHRRNESRRLARERALAAALRHDPRTSVDEAVRAAHSLERASLLGDAVAALPDPYRTVIVLRFFENRPPKEISERLGRSVHTVNTQLQRGLQRLREDLDAKSDQGRRAWTLGLLHFALEGAPADWLQPGIQRPEVYKVGQRTGLKAVGAAGAVAVAGLAAVRLLGGGSPPEPSTDSLPPRASSETGADAAPPEQLARVETEPRVPGTGRQLALEVLAEGDPVERARVALQVVTGPSPSPFLGRAPMPLAVDAAAARHPDEADRIRLDLHHVGAGWADASSGEEAPTGDPVVVHTDSLGRASLEIPGDLLRVVRIDAPGFATRFVVVPVEGATERKSLELSPASSLVIDRGALPPEDEMEIRLWSTFDGLGRLAYLERGAQEIRLDGLRPGKYRLVAFTVTGGLDYTLRYLEVNAPPDGVRQLDLSLGGCRDVFVDVRGLDPSAPALFASAFGPPDERGDPSWTQAAAVRQGIAEFRSLPPGPVVATVSSDTSNLTDLRFEVAPGEGPLKIEASIPPGELVVRHQGVDGRSFPWLLLEREEPSPAYMRWNGWKLIPRPLGAPDTSRFVGLSPGEHRLFAIVGSSLYRRNLELNESVTAIDLFEGPGADELHAVTIERGKGVPADSYLEVELIPGLWRAFQKIEDEVRLPGGPIQLRLRTDQLTTLHHRIDPAEVDVVRFEDSEGPQDVTLTCAGAGAGTLLEIRAQRGPTFLDRSLPERLALDEEERGQISLRPGSYIARTREGRTGRFDVGAGGGQIALPLE